MQHERERVEYNRDIKLLKIINTITASNADNNNPSNILQKCTTVKITHRSVTNSDVTISKFRFSIDFDSIFSPK